jgi:endo-1,4-beta-xylanase
VSPSSRVALRRLRPLIPALVTATVLGGTLLGGTAQAAASETAGASLTTKDQAGDQSLRALATRHRLPIGTAVGDAALTGDAAYRDRVGTEFSSVTPENVMKWEVLEPARGQYDWTAADRLVAEAQAHGQQVRGHTLVWHNQLPQWLKDLEKTATAEEIRQIVRTHIATVVGRYRGRIAQWDVVNEAVNDQDQGGGLRDSLFLRKLGPGYIADAFRWAHEADPKAVLIYNDYSNTDVNAKSTEIYDLVRGLRSDGVPIGGVGIQAHESATYTPTSMAANLRRIGALGLVSVITEADVRIDLPVDAAKLRNQATVFSTLLRTCLTEPTCISFTSWGFTDKYSWVPGFFAGQGAALFLDEQLGAKPAYEAMRTDLRTTPPVNRVRRR